MPTANTMLFSKYVGAGAGLRKTTRGSRTAKGLCMSDDPRVTIANGVAVLNSKYEFLAGPPGRRRALQKKAFAYVQMMFQMSHAIETRNIWQAVGVR